ncbi:hypothetical protein [Streptomyces sp. cmx-18-6]|uniref:hypothetical protein n=1 Tax=Streptomyces sp. cmx-18-6 TaxID=2790930 RepID=UPI00397E928F
MIRSVLRERITAGGEVVGPSVSSGEHSDYGWGARADTVAGGSDGLAAAASTTCRSGSVSSSTMTCGGRAGWPAAKGRACLSAEQSRSARPAVTERLVVFRRPGGVGATPGHVLSATPAGSRAATGDRFALGPSSGSTH